MSDSIYDINKKLLLHYGRDTVLNLPCVRVVWTTEQYEWRDNKDGFDIFDESGSIFLRTEYGPHYCDKYPNNPDMWVLESLVPNVNRVNGDLKSAYTYEPLWIFGVANSDRTPIWRAVKLLVDAWKRVLTQQVDAAKTESDLVSAEEVRMAKEKSLIKDILQDNTPDLVYDLVHGHAVTVGDINKTTTEEVTTNGK